MPDLFALVSGRLDADGLYLPRALVDFVAVHGQAMAITAAAGPVAALALSTVRARLARVSGLLLAVSALLVGVLLHNFPDEVFVNFRHAANLAATGHFSFLPDRDVDGCVDLLYYALLAGLSRVGVAVPLGA